MNALIELSLKRPIAVMAAVLLVLAFGLVALNTIPIQLTPDIRRPQIDVRTRWSGAAPVEVEREITNRIEQELGGLEGDEPARAIIEAQDREIAERSGRPRGAIKMIERAPTK